MIKISKSGNSILVEGLDNVFYPDNGKLTFPSNSLILTIDNSDMATFRSSANNDVMFSGLIEEITISNEAVTKDDIITKFGVVAYSTSGGGGGTGAVSSVNGQTGDVTLEIPTAQTEQEGNSNNYVYSDKDNRVIRKIIANKFTSSVQLEAVYWGGNGYDGSCIISGATTNKAGVMSSEDKTKLDSIDTAEIEQVIGEVAALQTDVEGKQDTLVSGTNIKTINGESVLGSGDIVISGGGSTDWNDITNKPTIPSVQGASYGTNVQYIYSNKDSLNYRSVASQRLVQKGGFTSMEYWYWGQSEKEATIMDFPYATSTNGGSMSPSDKSKLDGIPSMSVLTQAEYDALADKDANTLYFIKEG